MPAYLQLGKRKFPKDQGTLAQNFKHILGFLKCHCLFNKKTVHSLNQSFLHGYYVPNTVQGVVKMGKIWSLPSSHLHIT